MNRFKEDALAIIQRPEYADWMRRLGTPWWLPRRLRRSHQLPIEAVSLIVEYERVTEREDDYWARVSLDGTPANVFDEQSQLMAMEQAEKYGLKLSDWLYLARRVVALLRQKP